MIALIPAFIVGVLTSALGNFSNAGWWQILAFAILWRYLVLQDLHQPKKQAKLGWAFGLGYFSTGLWWLYISLHDVGGMHSAMAIAGVALLSGFLALFPSFAVWLGTRFSYKGISALAWASAWTLSEWLRAHILTGFPWIGYGDTQVDGPLMGIVPIFGTLGATFLVLWTANLIGSLPKNLFSTVFSVALVFITTAQLEKIEFTTPIGKVLDVRLIQGNFAQSMYFNAEKTIEQIEFYAKAMTEKSTDLVITPETAFQLPVANLPSTLIDELASYSKDSQTTLLTGVIGEVKGQYSNQALAIAPNGQTYTYNKEHLVPFGEYVPPGFKWFVNAIKIPLGDFAIGSTSQPNLSIQRKEDTNLYGAITICYEDVFGDELAHRIRKLETPTNFLINMTNLAWFGDSQAPVQQLRLSRLRSIETGLPTVRATNTGATAIINERGIVTAQLPGFKQDVLSGEVQARIGKTPYVRWGDLPILLLSLIILAIAILRLRKSRSIF